jgi:hypothetical protein
MSLQMFWRNELSAFPAFWLYVGSLFEPENGPSMFLQNYGICLPNYMASHPISEQPDHIFITTAMRITNLTPH